MNLLGSSNKHTHSFQLLATSTDTGSDLCKAKMQISAIVGVNEAHNELCLRWISRKARAGSGFDASSYSTPHWSCLGFGTTLFTPVRLLEAKPSNRLQSQDATNAVRLLLGTIHLLLGTSNTMNMVDAA